MADVVYANAMTQIIRLQMKQIEALNNGLEATAILLKQTQAEIGYLSRIVFDLTVLLGRHGLLSEEELRSFTVNAQQEVFAVDGICILERLLKEHAATL